jgi:hypothetical protein
VVWGLKYHEAAGDVQAATAVHRTFMEGLSMRIITADEQEAIDFILEELDKARAKHPIFPTDIVHCAGILCEEAGEAMQAALNVTYHGGKVSYYREELGHSGAMAIRNLINLKRMKKEKQ